MNPSPALIAIIVVVLMGAAVFWANPGRVVNRMFFTLALHASAWLWCVHKAVEGGESRLWIQLASAIGAFIPAHLWLLKEGVVAGTSLLPKRDVRVFILWITAGAVLAALCFTDWFMGELPVRGRPAFGGGYFVYMGGVLSLYGLLCRETILQIRSLQGVSRLELQIMLLGGSVTAVTVIVLMALRAVLGVLWPIQIQPVIVMAFYVGTVVAISTHRVFDARQIILVGAQKLILIVVATAAAVFIDWCAQRLVPRPVDLLVTTGIVLWFAALLQRSLNRIFQFYPEATSARQAAFTAARETRVDNLERAFRSVIKGWGQTDHAIVLSGQKEGVAGDGLTLAAGAPVLEVMRELKWATPERLARERPSDERQEVAQFLKNHGLGVLVLAEGATLTVLAGAGVGAGRQPYTYPQVTQLIELASIIESAFERAHFSVKAQHAEQLATVGLLGASLAHEIRNPLVSIKTFVQLLPKHHQDAAFREKFFRLISDEVTRIDQLTEQLLDLASPRTYSAILIELHPILRASLDLVAAKAEHRNVRLLTDFQAQPDHAYTDASAAKQVMLNLCFNAIQAVESNREPTAERWVKIATRNTSEGIEMAVADSGPGIAPEIRPRLFQPFQTTKSTGFGLGLAICSDILANLNASISVDAPAPGCGATFRVIFPCQPSSS